MTQHELLFAKRSGSLGKLTIRQKDDGRYQLQIRLRKKQEEYVLVGIRNKPRVWTNLNTLANHLREKYGTPLSIVVLLSRRAS